MRHWRRRDAEARETWIAAAAGAAVGAGVFYLARVLLAREPLPTPEREARALPDGSRTQGLSSGPGDRPGAG